MSKKIQEIFFNKLLYLKIVLHSLLCSNSFSCSRFFLKSSDECLCFFLTNLFHLKSLAELPLWYSISMTVDINLIKLEYRRMTRTKWWTSYQWYMYIYIFFSLFVTYMRTNKTNVQMAMRNSRYMENKKKIEFFLLYFIDWKIVFFSVIRLVFIISSFFLSLPLSLFFLSHDDDAFGFKSMGRIKDSFRHQFCW